MRVLVFACCDVALQDARLNSITLVNLIEDVSAPAFPIAIARLTAYAFFQRDPGEPDVQMARVKAELNGQVVIDQPAEIQFQGKLRTRMIGEMHGFPVSGPGDLRVSLLMGDPPAEAAAWIIKVSSAGAPELNIVAAGAPAA